MDIRINTFLIYHVIIDFSIKKINNLLSIFIYHLFCKETGIYHIENTLLTVYKNQRIYKHKI